MREEMRLGRSLVRVQGKVGWFIILISGVMVVGLLFALRQQESARLDAVKSGKVRLVCELKGGLTQVPPEKVVDLQEDRWVFTNGSAIACRLVGIE